MGDPASSNQEFVDELSKTIAEFLGATTASEEHRLLAEKCLQTITRFGVGIDRRRIESAISAAHTRDQGAIERINATDQLRLRELLDIWREYSGPQSAGPAEIYQRIGESVLKAGEPLLAYDILGSGLKHWPNDVRLRQLLALSLARSGAPRRASRLLQKLVSEGNRDEETLSLLARTCKDQWQIESDPDRKRQLLRESHDLYRQGYEHASKRGSASGAIYAGINAATTSLILGDTRLAIELSKSVAGVCKRKPDLDSDYWAVATLGECALIEGRLGESLAYYRRAVHLAGNHYADIASTRRNAELVLRHLGMDVDHVLADCFCLPNVGLFSGHLIDLPGKPRRFPHSQIERIRAELKEALENANVGFAYSAAACGGDLLFLEAMANREGETHIVLPLAEKHFIRASVSVDTEHDWVPRFESALKSATHVTVVNDFSETPDPLHFEYSNRIMTGLALLHANTLGVKLMPFAVWDGGRGRGPGGTGSIIELWKSLGLEPQVIRPDVGILKETSFEGEAEEPADSRSDSNPRRFDKEIRAVLFADVVGYSKITEEEIPIFVEEFMSPLASSIGKSGVKLETSNTWGDAIYFVFGSVEDAGLTALEITELVNNTDWRSRGLKRQLRLRTGLHVGPVFRFVDPVTGASTHSGAHVSRAARIEPVTPPGEVYASEAFAAIAAAENVKTFECEYVGITPMAKGYGNFPTYHVQRCNAGCLT